MSFSDVVFVFSCQDREIEASITKVLVVSTEMDIDDIKGDLFSCTITTYVTHDSGFIS